MSARGEGQLSNGNGLGHSDYAGHMTMVGNLEFAGIMQEIQTATATGEGLSGFLDLDFDLG